MSIPAPGPIFYGILGMAVCISVSKLNGIEIPGNWNLALAFAMSASYYRYATNWSRHFNTPHTSSGSTMPVEISLTIISVVYLLWHNRSEWNPFVLISILFIAISYNPPLRFKGLREYPWFKNLLVAWAWALLGYLFIPESENTGQLYLPAIFIFLNVLFVSMLFDRLDSNMDRSSGHETLHHIMGDRQSILLVITLIAAMVCELKILEITGTNSAMVNSSLILTSLILAILVPLSTHKKGFETNLTKWIAEACLLAKLMVMILA